MEISLEREREELLHRSGSQDSKPSDGVDVLLYSQLRAIAGRLMKDQPDGHTLQPTALVHEAYLRLSRTHKGGFEDKEQHLAAAAQAMRCVLVDHARRKARLPRRLQEGREVPSVFERIMDNHQARALDVEALVGALERLRSRDPLLAQAVHLHFFVGLGMARTAESLGIGLRKLERDWSIVKLWLRQEIL